MKNLFTKIKNWISKHIQINKEDGNIFIFSKTKIKGKSLKNSWIIGSQIDIQDKE